MAIEIRVLHHSELDEWGYSSRRRREPPGRGLLVRLRAGLFAVREEWEQATPEEQVVARARALARDSKRPPVFSHETAAALHGLPLYRPDPSRVHIIVPIERPGRVLHAVRHRGEVGSEDVVVRRGVSCTSLVRTVADVSRTASFESAVTVTDAALRMLFASAPNRYDFEAAREFLDSAGAVARLSAHGRRRAETVLTFADGRAQLPGESVSRVRLAQLGFRTPRLQVEVAGARRGSLYFVDFALDDVGAFGEFDGRIKYIDGRFRIDRSGDEALDEEKQREDWIRGVTGRRLVRWGWSHIATAATLGERLCAFGITPARPGFGA